MLSATHEAMLCPTLVNGNRELFGSGATYMKAKVFVSLKPGVLDPQGKAIQHSVELLGFSGISDVRQGKYFEISLDSALDDSQARESVDRMAREVLSNPIIEEYRVEIEA